MLTARLPLLPIGAREISDSLAILDDGEHTVFFNAAGPIYSCRSDDRTGLRLGAVTVIQQGLAGVTAMGRALCLHRTTLFRDVRKFEGNGVKGLVEKRRGPKGPHTLTPDVQRRAQKRLDRGDSIRSTAASVGVSERGLRHAIKRGLLTVHANEPATAAALDAPATVTGPRARAVEDQSCEAGVAVKRTGDRALACVGKLVEATPEFTPVEAVPGAGVLLALPALLEQGLLDVGQEVFGGLRNGFFGLRSILLAFAFMALLRIKTPEQLTEHAPGELGLVLGLDRAPEVKTLRRKLRELGKRELADTFARQLTEHWTEAEPQELGLLYVDGHVRPYHGRTHSLPKQHVQQRGRPMPGTKDFHVNDRRADPLFFVTAEATEGLLAMLDSTLLPEVRRLVGPRRRVTIVFDREGWSPRLFAKWKDEKFDVLTYCKGKQTRWQKRFFTLVEGRVGGKKVAYLLAERTVKLSNGLQVREIRRLTEDGHQTAVITTDEMLSILAVAHRMFSRWRQENFFRYMRHEFALDHLCTYEVESADPKRLVVPPQRAALQKKLEAARAACARLVQCSLKLVPGRQVRVGNKTVDEEELDGLIRKRDAEVEQLLASIAALPKQVRLDTVLDPDEIVQLERERKVLVDAIKLTAYRAESHLARLVEPIFARHDDEARKFLKSVFQATADILPDKRHRRLTIRFHGLASPRATRALADLCVLVSERDVRYPGTNLRLHFEAPASQE
jgi:acetolactate synthase small subunit